MVPSLMCVAWIGDALWITSTPDCFPFGDICKDMFEVGRSVGFTDGYFYTMMFGFFISIIGSVIYWILASNAEGMNEIKNDVDNLIAKVEKQSWTDVSQEREN